MRLQIRGELPFITLTLVHRGSVTSVENVLVDTGSASTVLNADVVALVGVLPEPGDRVRALRGVGGREFVFTHRIDRLEVDGRGLSDFEVEVGEMDYGFEIGGILGMDFLRSTGAILNLRKLTLEYA